MEVAMVNSSAQAQSIDRKNTSATRLLRTQILDGRVVSDLDVGVLQ